MGYSLKNIEQYLDKNGIKIPSVEPSIPGFFEMNVGNGEKILISEGGLKEFDKIMKEKAKEYVHHPILSRPDGLSRIRIARKVEEIFKALRFSKEYHLGMGDIKLLRVYQDDILDIIISDEELNEEEREKLRKDVLAGKYE